jgi:putative IMPACT (imprinted ancient) family translation regulator
VAVVVTRYFGGVLLGTGGLTHAYSQGASLAVAAAKLRPMRPATAMQITCDYGFYGQLSYLLPRFEVFTAGSDFGEKVTLDLRCPTENVKPLCNELTELTSGQLSPIIGQEEYLDLSGAKSGF